MSNILAAERLEGWLWKQGAKGIVKGYKKRWFQLSPQNDKELHYHVNNGAISKGYIDIRLINNVTTDEPPKRDIKGFYFYINTSERVYTLIAPTDKDLQHWLSRLEALMNPNLKAQQVVTLSKALEDKNSEIFALLQKHENDTAQWEREKAQLVKDSQSAFKSLEDLQKNLKTKDVTIEEMKKEMELLLTDMEKIEVTLHEKNSELNSMSKKGKKK